MRRYVLCLPATIAVLLAAAPAAMGAVSTTSIITDPFSNSDSQHATAVEPDTFASGSTIVAVSQVGRYFDGGSSSTAFATSSDSGASWAAAGALPRLTVHQNPAGTHDRTTDPSVAYDARHGVWLAQSLALDDDSAGNPVGTAVVVNRSTDGGLTWSNPVTAAAASSSQDFDKNWIVCDNTLASPGYGNCYATWDDFGDGDRILMNKSSDGGLTWSSPTQTAGGDFGLGGQPVVQPNGNVIVPADNGFDTAIIAFRSTDQGASWSSAVTVASTPTHTVAGNLRTSPLPSAEIDGAGKVYVVWQDCRFRRACRVNDIVMSTSTDGVTWTSPARIPIDSVTSSVDHFIPGIAVDPSTSGSTAKLGLTYYFYRSSKCARKGCTAEVGYIESTDGGSNWSNQTDVAGPFNVNWMPNTNQGRMVGDYISTSWVGGKAFGAFAVPSAPSGTVFNQPIFVPTGGLTAASGGFVNTSSGEHPVPGAAADHASPQSAIRHR